MQAPTALPPEASVATEAIQLEGLDLILLLMSLFILTVFFTSLIKWIVLLTRGARLFGDNALVPARSRARPYWNPLLFIFFLGVLIVSTVTLNGWAVQSGWIAKPAESLEAGLEEDLAVPETIVPETIDPLDAVKNSEAVPESFSPPAASSISVPHLILSSAGMLVATLVTILLAQMLRPSLSRGLREGDESTPRERPRIGLLPQPGDVSLGLTAAWLILPPTMMMMALVSILQKYSHPVLEALQPTGPDSTPNFGVFAVLFFTTAIITPFVEEFWFRGCLQGGLQRLADMGIATRSQLRSDTIDSAEVVEEARLATDSEIIADATGAILADPYPYATPRELDPPAARPIELRSSQEVERDRDTRADWIPTAVWPIVVTSIIFAMMHWGQGLAPIPLFFLSLGLGYLYRQTGSLVPSIVVHFTLNGFTMCMTLLQILN